MDEKLAGKLVYLTIHSEVWYRELNPKFNVPMVNRLAKIVKVFDWDSDEGRFLLSEREKTGKWDKLNSKDFKFVLKVYCPDLRKNGKGVTVEEMLPMFFPGTKLAMFELLPVWMLQSLQKAEKDIFKLVSKDSDTDTDTKSKSKTHVSQRNSKKST
jgi:hypothetical protein